MLSSSGLFWTQIAAAVAWFFVVNLVYGLWKLRQQTAASRGWATVKGKIVASDTKVPATHDDDDQADVSVAVRYHYRVGATDYENDRVKFGGRKRLTRMAAAELTAKYPLGRSVTVHFDPAHPAKSALELKATDGFVGLAVFLIVFGAIAGVLTAHAIAGKMLMMSNGLPYFALGLPIASLLVAAGSVFMYFKLRREREASAKWPTTQGAIVLAQVVSEESREEDSDGDTRYVTRYRPEVSFAYRVEGQDYSTNTWKTGMTALYSDTAEAERVTAKYPKGRAVTVHYNPDEPNIAVLEPQNRDGAAVPLVFGAAFGIVGGLMMWLMVYGEWVNAATGS